MWLANPHPILQGGPLLSMAKAVFIPPAELVVFLRLSTQQEKVPNAPAFGTFGGDEGDRTPYLLNAIQALSQVSYTPTVPRAGFRAASPL